MCDKIFILVDRPHFENQEHYIVHVFVIFCIIKSYIRWAIDQFRAAYITIYDALYRFRNCTGTLEADVFSDLDHTIPVHLFYQIYKQETRN